MLRTLAIAAALAAAPALAATSADDLGLDELGLDDDPVTLESSRWGCTG